MGDTIDSLNIEVQASAVKANDSVEKLIGKLDRLSTSLMQVNGHNLVNLASGVNRLSSAMQSMKNVGTADFTRLAKNISKMGSIDSAGISNAAASMHQFSNALNSLGSTPVSANAARFGELAKGIAQLGYKSSTQAIENIPKLAAAMQQLMTTLSSTPKVSQNLIDMTNALAGLVRTGASSGRAANSLSTSLNTYTGATKKAEKATKSFSQIAGNFYSNFFLIIRGAKKALKSVESSMDYVETFNYWNVTLEKIGKEFGSQFEGYGEDNAESYVDSFRDRLATLTQKMTGYQIGDSGDLTMTSGMNLGLDPEQLMNFQAKIGAVTNAVGLTGEASIDTSKALSMLSADISSFTNADLSSVMTNLQSGLIGQSRALYKYGIDITNANLQNYAYANGVTKAVSEMTQAEKMQLRLIAILDQSKVAWGDQANTLNSVANQYRILKQQVSNLARTIGNLFLPIVKTVLPVVNGLVISLNRLFTTLGFHLFGSNWLKDLQDGISGGYGGDGLDDIADSAEEATGGLEDAANAAKKLKGTLRSFDELNVINTETDSGSGSSSGGGSGGGSDIDLSGAISGALADYESIWGAALADSENKAQVYADIISSAFTKAWSAVEPFRNAIVNLWDNGLGKLANFSWTSLKGFYEEFLIPIGTWAFGTEDSGLTRFVNVINASLMAINWDELSESLKNFWIAIEPYAEQFGEGLIDFFEDLSGIAVSVINQFPSLFNGIADALNNGNPEMARRWGYALGELAVGIFALKGISSIVTSISNLIKAISSLSVVQGAVKLIRNLIGVVQIVSGGFGTWSEAISWVFPTIGKVITFVSKFATNIAGIGSIISGAVLAVTNFFSMWENGWSILSEILKDIGIALAAVGAVILGIATGPVAVIVAAVVAAGSSIAIVVHDNWAAICEWFSNAADWFDTNVVTPIVDFFKGLWESVAGYFSNLWEDISAIWNTASKWFSDNVVEPVVGFFQGFYKRVRQIFEGLWIIVQAIWIVVSDWFNETVIMPVVGFFQELWEDVSGFFSQLWIDIQTVWSAVSTWFNNTVIVPVTDFFKGVWENVSTYFTNLWEDIQGVWENVSTWFDTNIIAPVTGAFKTACEAIGGFFDGLWEGIKSGVVGAMNAVIGGIESGINFIVSGINNIIGGFNKVVSWAASIVDVNWNGVDLVPTVTLPRIQAYAVGGFPEDGLFMANHGELVGKFSNGKTAVANNEQITQGIADAIYPAVYNAVSAAMKNNGGNSNVTFQVEGDPNGLFKVVRKKASEYNDRTGRPAFDF